MLVAHIPVLLAVALLLFALSVFAIYLIIKRILLWLSTFIELRRYPERTPLNRRVETWQNSNTVAAVELRQRLEAREQRQRILDLLKE